MPRRSMAALISASTCSAPSRAPRGVRRSPRSPGVRAAVGLSSCSTRKRQAVALRRRLRPGADDDRRHRRAGVGQLEKVGDGAHRVQRRAHGSRCRGRASEAEADVLRQDDRVERGDVAADKLSRDCRARRAWRNHCRDAIPVGAEVTTSGACSTISCSDRAPLALRIDVNTIEPMRLPDDDPPATASRTDLLDEGRVDRGQLGQRIERGPASGRAAARARSVMAGCGGSGRRLEVDHALGLGESERAVHGLARGVVQRRVGRQLGATARWPTARDRGDERSRHAAAPRAGTTYRPSRKATGVLSQPLT